MKGGTGVFRGGGKSETGASKKKPNNNRSPSNGEDAGGTQVYVRERNNTETNSLPGVVGLKKPLGCGRGYNC